MKIIKYIGIGLAVYLICFGAFFATVFLNMETPTIENPYDYKNIIHNSDKNTVKRLIVEQNREIEQLKNDIKNYGYRADSTGRVINDRVADITHMDEEISHLNEAL